MRKRQLVCLLALGFLSAAPRLSDAAVRDWLFTPTVTNGNPTPAVTYFDVGFDSRTYFAVDRTLYGLKSELGDSTGTPVTAGAAIENFPSVVPLADGKKYIFIGSQDGYLYKISADDMTVVQSRDMRRGGCASDAIQATPTVQLAAYSNGFTPAKDLVFVPTYHGCGDTTLNQVIALDASDIRLTNPSSVVWTFNAGEYEMDFIAEGCSLDYDRNRLYCGSNLPLGSYQNTVWAIDTNDGSLFWAGNYNSVRTRPQLSRGVANHLYVADYLGTLHAVDRDSGAENWMLQVTTAVGMGAAAYIATNMWAEFRAPYGDMIFITDSAGTLHALYDSGAIADGGIEAWSSYFAGGQKVLSLGSVSPTLGKVYVGLDDGTVHQLDLATGSDEAYRTISAAPKHGDVVTDPTLHLGGGAEISKLVASANSAMAGTITKQFNVPWANASSGASLQACTADLDCVTLNAPMGCGKKPDDACCAVGACDVKSGTCYAKPQDADDPKTPGVESCDDGFYGTRKLDHCTTNRRCVAGACIGKWNYAQTGCPAGPDDCSVDPRRACGPGKTCLLTGDQSYSCVDTQNDVKYCGSSARSCEASPRGGGTAWGGDRICNHGVCERDTKSFCAMPDAAMIQEKMGANLSGLAFSRINNICLAWGSSFDETLPRNEVVSVAPDGKDARFSTGGQLGLMGGGLCTVPGVAAEVYVSFSAPPTVGSGRVEVQDGAVLSLNEQLPSNQQALPTGCVDPCPFALPAYNLGPTAPATDNRSVINGAGKLTYGNYRANGDIWVLSKDQSGWHAAPAWDNEIPPKNDPPWCPSGGCKGADRIVAIDFEQGALGDGLLRIALRDEVWFIDVATRKVVSTVILSKTGLPNADKIRQIVSLTADPLNGAGSCIVEAVAEGGVHILFVVRAKGEYDETLMRDRGSAHLYKDVLTSRWLTAWPPRQEEPVIPDFFTDGDGRITAAAQQQMFRIVPVSPKDSGAKVKITQFSLPR